MALHRPAVFPPGRLLRLVAAGLVASAMLAVGCGSAETAAAGGGDQASANLTTGRFPLAVSSDGHYLVDATGAPFQIRGDAPWDLLMVTSTDAVTYLDARAAQGFNAVLVDLMEHRNWGNLPNVPRTCAMHSTCSNGPLPFTTRVGGGSYTASTDTADLSSYNTAYFDAVDVTLDAAAQRGMLVILSPFYLGWSAHTRTTQAATNEGWSAEAHANSAASCAAFGTFLGNRYKDRSNILWSWVSDDDLTPGSAQETCTRAVMAALRAAGATQLYTAHLNREQNSSASTGESSTGTWQVNAAYTKPTFVGGRPFTQGRAAYARGPAFVLEDYYEGENSSTRSTLRYAAWGSVLSTTGGFVFGNNPVWFSGSGWLSNLNSTGATDAVASWAAADAYRWHTMAPTTVLCTAGCGTEAGDDYVPQAISTTAASAVLYLPPAHTGPVSVDLSRLSGSVAARWRDPVSGAETPIGTYGNRGTQAFTPPGVNSVGANDWVLMLAPSSSPGALEILPGAPTIPPRGAIPFSARGGSGSGYAWVLATNASGAALDAGTGAYVAGSTGSVTDVVRLVDSAGNEASTSITVTAGASVTPASGTAPPGGSLTFTATGGSGTGWTWSMATNRSGGSISSTGVYTAGPTAGVGDVVQAMDSLGNVGTATVTVTAPVAAAPSVRVNAGGGAVGTFAADRLFSGGSTYSTSTAIDTGGAANAAPEAVYRSERYGSFSYTPTGLSPGQAYTVRLHFAEIYWTAAGRRLFDVRINGAQVLTSFDIFAAAGAAFRAITRDFTATAAANGTITVQFLTLRDNAKVSAVEVLGP